MPSKFQVLQSGRKYPGRDRVVSRDDARDYLYRRRLREDAGEVDPLACERPYVAYGIGLPSMFEPDQSKLPVEFEGRCRKCGPCLAHRRRLWTARAVDEIAASDRTWFGTLTVAPDRRFQLDVVAEALVLRPNGVLLGDLDDDEQYSIRADFIGKEVTRWFKRLRKSGAKFRYLLVFEAHKDGYPHVHLLLHESALPISKRHLEAQWNYGFSSWRLVDRDPRAAVYVCKYLAKDALTRVRASQKYGQQTLVQRMTERLQAVTRGPLSERTNGVRTSGERGSGVSPLLASEASPNEVRPNGVRKRGLGPPRANGTKQARKLKGPL